MRQKHQFQFHKGTIKTYVHVAEHTEDVNFNSIKVRLKRVDFKISLKNKIISIP